MYYVYILTNQTNTVLYTGVTRNLIRRVFEHDSKFVNSFTKKYKVSKLVYYEVHKDILQAIAREKKLKRWHRDWKIRLINDFNPQWHNLYAELGISLEI